jgi:hypothetical protein
LAGWKIGPTVPLFWRTLNAPAAGEPGLSAAAQHVPGLDVAPPLRGLRETQQGELGDTSLGHGFD